MKRFFIKYIDQINLSAFCFLVIVILLIINYV
jgi:hypothetical protein